MSARAGLERIPSYRSAPLAGVDLDLRDNTNLFGVPAAATAAARAATWESLRDYPPVGGDRLVAALAAFLDVPAASVVVGCGSDDLIDAALRAVAAPGERVAHADPSFSMVPIFARLNGLEPVGVPLRPDGSADVDGLLATGARVIYLCSPNNPTGTVTDAAAIRRCVAEAPGVVILDEAYAEFAGIDSRASAPGADRLLVTRTFSKAWGLAGLRVGYALGAPALVEAVAKARGPYTLNAVGEAAAVAALARDAEWMRRTAAEAAAARDRLAGALAPIVAARGGRVWASRANFVFIQLVEGPDGGIPAGVGAAAVTARAVAAHFQARGIGIRAFEALPGIGDAIRIGVAPWPQLERVVAAAREAWG
jgi:histidinol-phosphate aminotransferase